MDPVSHKRTKHLLLRDFKESGKDLGSFALDYMTTYDDVCYEVKLTKAYSWGKPVKGTAVLGTQEAVDAFLDTYKITGDFSVTLVDTQKEFFRLLEEIKEDLADQTDPNSCYVPALKELGPGGGEGLEA